MTIDLAHALGLTVVCEGVETLEQHQVVAAMGSNSCQGFYYGRPANLATAGGAVRNT